MLDKKNSILKEERAVLVGLIHKDQTETQVHEYLDELAFLAHTAGAVAVKRFTQKLLHPDSKTFVTQRFADNQHLKSNICKNDRPERSYS
jgi:GTP-binding protein HflX